jgi:hypothetical protein
MNSDMHVSTETWACHDGDTGWAVSVTNGTTYLRESGHAATAEDAATAQAAARARLVRRYRTAARA